MTKSLRFALISATIFMTPFVAAERYISHRVFSTPAASMPLPDSANFRASEIEVLNAGWMNSIFDNSGCESALSTKLPGHFELQVAADHSLKILWRGRSSAMLNQAYSTYVPVHYKYGQAIPAHLLVQLHGYVTLHVEISKHSFFGNRTATISIVQSQPNRAPKLLPILKAYGN